MSTSQTELGTIELHGTGTHNRGAELMTIATVRRLRNVDEKVQIVVPPRYGSATERGQLNLLVNDEFPSRNILERLWAKSATDRCRRIVGLVRSGDANTVLDASGFAYSDQWGPNAAKALLKKMGKSYRQSQKLILLPQALGPFQNPQVRSYCSQLFDRATLVYARDRISFEHALEICDENKLSLAPDFTLELPADQSSMSHSDKVLLVPNLRMTDKMGADGEGAYIGLLKNIVEVIRSQGITPTLLLHDKNEDRKVLPKLFESTGPLPTLENDSPLALKAILGEAKLVIASRFHALASALAKGTPSLAIGWSHKYDLLLSDFACPDMKLTLDMDREAIDSKLLVCLGETHQTQTRALLIDRGRSLVKKTDQMWDEIISQISNAETEKKGRK